jgi:hypothetical protein
MTDFPILVLEVDEPVTLYRGCHGSEPATLTDAMRSNYERDRRPHPAERRAIALYMSLSMFDSPEPIRWAARRRPDRVGSHIARVELRPGRGFCRADTSGPGHWSVWGLPRQLAASVVEVFAIE